MNKFFPSALLVLSVPVVETWALRRQIHHSFGASVTQIGIHASDIYVPAGVIGLVAFWALQRKAPLTVMFRIHGLLLNGTLFFLSLALAASFASLPRTGFLIGIGIVALLLFCALTFSSAFFVFLSPEELRKRVGEFRFYAVLAILGALLLVSYPIILETSWSPLSHATGYLVSAVLNLLGLKVTYLVRASEFEILHPKFYATISMGCSGLDGIFFFLFGYLFLGSIDPGIFFGFHSVWISLLGVLMMFSLNLFRISLFFIVAVALSHSVSTDAARNFILWAFHANIGWVLYFVGLGFVYHNLYRRQKASPLRR